MSYYPRPLYCIHFFTNMPPNEDSQGLATPGFAGFVPSMKYQFGLTYGNATRGILATDPSLKKGLIQQDYQRRIKAAKVARSNAAVTEIHTPAEELTPWKVRNKYATGDDRFSFPPVPGYTGILNLRLGYIPRSQEHFGHAFVQTTNESLSNFKQLLRTRQQLPPRVQSFLKAKQAKKLQAESSTDKPEVTALPKVAAPKASIANDDMSPYRLPENHAQKTFISGYTGFVPRLQNHFGEPYPHSVRHAITEFTQKAAPRNPYAHTKSHGRPADKKIEMTTPIPGYTGKIPGSRTCYSMTFGKTSEVAYDYFNHRDSKGFGCFNYRRISNGIAGMPVKDLSKSLPIPGYKGHSK